MCIALKIVLSIFIVYVIATLFDWFITSDDTTLLGVLERQWEEICEVFRDLRIK